MSLSKACAFCGEPMGTGKRAKRTREHVFPAWLDPYLPGRGGDRTFHVTVHSGEHGGVLRQWSSPELSLIARQVCSDCNGGWMSELETAAKPYLESILHGHRRTFYENGQRTISGWAIKTALALDLANRDAHDPISSAHYRAITAKKGMPHDRAQVYIGVYDGNVTLNHQLRRLTLNEGRPNETDAFLSTFIVGHVLFQVFLHDYPEPIVLSRASGTLDYLRQIWPVEGEVTWGAMRIVRDDVLQQLKDGLSPLIERTRIDLR